MTATAHPVRVSNLRRGARIPGVSVESPTVFLFSNPACVNSSHFLPQLSAIVRSFRGGDDGAGAAPVLALILSVTFCARAWAANPDCERFKPKSGDTYRVDLRATDGRGLGCTQLEFQYATMLELTSLAYWLDTSRRTAEPDLLRLLRGPQLAPHRIQEASQGLPVVGLRCASARRARSSKPRSSPASSRRRVRPTRAPCSRKRKSATAVVPRRAQDIPSPGITT